MKWVSMTFVLMLQDWSRGGTTEDIRIWNFKIFLEFKIKLNNACEVALSFPK